MQVFRHHALILLGYFRSLRFYPHPNPHIECETHVTLHATPLMLPLRPSGPCESAVFGCCVPVDAECFGDGIGCLACRDSLSDLLP
jgi:hypothetical protein